MSGPSPIAAPGSPGIARILRAEILAGERAVGSRLPAISDLARRYRTTTVTARRALRDLEDEGLVRVGHGVGTFVADWSREYDLLPAFSSGAAGVETRVLGCGARRLAEAARMLGLAAPEVIALERLRLVNGRPVALQTSCAGPEAAEALAAYTPDGSLYAALARRGWVPVAAEETLTAVALPAAAAALLATPAGSPGWRSARLTRDDRGRALLYDEAYLPGERIRLRLERRGRETRAAFEPIGPDGEELRR
jgi:GntR family transcriptional regulator